MSYVWSQMEFRILCPSAPCEIVGTIDRMEFYFRLRGENWDLYSSVFDYAKDKKSGSKALAMGKAEDVGNMSEHIFGVMQIMKYVEEMDGK